MVVAERSESERALFRVLGEISDGTKQVLAARGLEAELNVKWNLGKVYVRDAERKERLVATVHPVTMATETDSECMKWMSTSLEELRALGRR